MRICSFSLSYIIVNEIPSDFGLMVRQNKSFEDVSMGSDKWCSAFFTISFDILQIKKIDQLIDKIIGRLVSTNP